MIWKVSLVLGLVLCASCFQRPAISEHKVKQIFTGHHGALGHIGEHEPERHEVYAWAYPSYEFTYHVDDPHTHDMKGQHEIRDGDKVTGDYWLIQPDGLKRTVKYHSDHKNGFDAEVNYLPYRHHHHEVKEHHEKHAPKEKVKEVIHKVLEIKKDHDDDDDDRRSKVLHDEKRNDWVRRGHDDRHGPIESHHREYDHRRKENREERGNNRGGERRHNEHRQNEDHSWGIQRWVEDHKDRNSNKRPGEIMGWKKDHRREEHWKNGALVGWTEGIGRDHRRGDERRERNDDRSHEDLHDHISSHVPINFKPLIPYGHRLH